MERYVVNLEHGPRWAYQTIHSMAVNMLDGLPVDVEYRGVTAILRFSVQDTSFYHVAKKFSALSEVLGEDCIAVARISASDDEILQAALVGPRAYSWLPFDDSKFIL